MTTNGMTWLVTGVVMGGALGALLAWLVLAGRYAGVLAAATTETTMLRGRVDELTELGTGPDPAILVGEVNAALSRVERQVGVLERDRVEQFGELGERLAHVDAATQALKNQTASLVGSLNASSVRGTWGESQIRRVLESAGMLARCDFEEQVSAVSMHGATVRPDVVVRLPGDKVIVVDAKSPLSAYLAAQREGATAAERSADLTAHGAAVRRHVDALCAKDYWSAFTTTPQMVVCFVPADAILAAALSADPALFDDALRRHVVLCSPSTLLALLRTVAFTWQQDALATEARQLLDLSRQLHSRLCTLGGHVAKLGSSLTRSVESYNAFVGTLESRVLVTARRMDELGFADGTPPTLKVVETGLRPLTAAELIDSA